MLEGLRAESAGMPGLIQLYRKVTAGSEWVSFFHITPDKALKPFPVLHYSSQKTWLGFRYGGC